MLRPLELAGGKGASYKVNGQSYAYAQATAIAEAFGLAMSNAETCGKCKTAGKVFASSVERILLKASAYVDVDIKGNARDGYASDSYEIVAKDIKKVTIEAFAYAMAEARAEDDKCSGGGYISIGAGLEGDTNDATCHFNLQATETTAVKDAIAAVVAGASASVCNSKFYTGEYKITARVCPLAGSGRACTCPGAWPTALTPPLALL